MCLQCDVPDGVTSLHKRDARAGQGSRNIGVDSSASAKSSVTSLRFSCISFLAQVRQYIILIFQSRLICSRRYILLLFVHIFAPSYGTGFSYMDGFQRHYS